MATFDHAHEIICPPSIRAHNQRSGGGLQLAVADRAADLLLAVEDLRADFDKEDANAVRWVEPYIEAIWHEVDVLVRRLAQ